MEKSKQKKIQNMKYREILKNNPHDALATKCLIKILELQGDEVQTKNYELKLETLKYEWVANFKNTEIGERWDNRFKDFANKKAIPKEGQLKNWDESWLDFLTGADIDCVYFHVFRANEVFEQFPESSKIYWEIAEFINDGGNELDDALFEIAIDQCTINDQFDMCLLILELMPENYKSLKFIAKHAFHNLGDYPIDMILQQFKDLYKEQKGWSDPEILLYLGMIYACIGEMQKSLKMLKKLKKQERRMKQHNIVILEVSESNLYSKKLEFFIAEIIKETESKNIT